MNTLVGLPVIVLVQYNEQDKYYKSTWYCYTYCNNRHPVLPSCVTFDYWQTFPLGDIVVVPVALVFNGTVNWDAFPVRILLKYSAIHNYRYILLLCECAIQYSHLHGQRQCSWYGHLWDMC